MVKILLLECLIRYSYRECLGRLDFLFEYEGLEKVEIKIFIELVFFFDMFRIINKFLLILFYKLVEYVVLDIIDVESGKEIREFC